MNKAREFGLRLYVWFCTHKIKLLVLLAVILMVSIVYRVVAVYRDLNNRVEQITIDLTTQNINHSKDIVDLKRVAQATSVSVTTIGTQLIAVIEQTKISRSQFVEVGKRLDLLSTKLQTSNARPLNPLYRLYRDIKIGQTTVKDLAKIVNSQNEQKIIFGAGDFLTLQGKDELDPTKGALVMVRTYGYHNPIDESKYWLAASFDQNDPKYLVRKAILWYQGKTDDTSHAILRK